LQTICYCLMKGPSVVHLLAPSYRRLLSDYECRATTTTVGWQLLATRIGDNYPSTTVQLSDDNCCPARRWRRHTPVKIMDERGVGSLESSRTISGILMTGGLSIKTITVYVFYKYIYMCVYVYRYPTHLNRITRNI